MTVILAMALNQPAQKRAQIELDTVVGAQRMPTVADMANLPYLAACIKESMRLHTLVPNGGARVAPKDDIVNGYFIAAGSVILPNIW